MPLDRTHKAAIQAVSAVVTHDKVLPLRDHNLPILIDLAETGPPGRVYVGVGFAEGGEAVAEVVGAGWDVEGVGFGDR